MRSRLILIAGILLALLLSLIGFGAISATAQASPTYTKDITWGYTQPTASPTAAPTGEKAVPLQKMKKAWGTTVAHASDDSGYTGPIHIVCENGTHRYLYPGDSTFKDPNGCSLSGVSRIVVALNQNVYCKNYVPPYENTYFYTGTNYVPSNRTYKCYSQRPLRIQMPFKKHRVSKH